MISSPFFSTVAGVSRIILIVSAIFSTWSPGAGVRVEAKSSPTQQTTDWQHQRNRMVSDLNANHFITDARVLSAMRTVPRHLFLAEQYRKNAYNFGNLPIGENQVIGDPYLVAFMTQSLGLKSTDTVLEIGTGCGYQAAVLAKLVKQVYSIEIYPSLADSARQRLNKLGYKNIEVKTGDGYQGWPEHAPFDAIIVTAHPDAVPQKLIEQLKISGRMVIPVGGTVQRMQLITRTKSDISIKNLDLTGLVL